MLVNEPLAPRALHQIGRSGGRPALVVIGAMDGVSFDELANYITTYRWSGLYVEPMPEQFRRLVLRHRRLGLADGNRYENGAIAAHDGTVRMLTIRQEAIDRGLVLDCFGGMSSIDPPRNGLASAHDAATVAAYGEMVEVPCLTLATLFARHAVERVDILSIDTEGWDFRILSQLDLTRFRPRFLRVEWVNLTSDEQAALVSMLETHDYVMHRSGQNLDAVPSEFWAELRTLSPDQPEPSPPAAPTPQITVVTEIAPPASVEDGAALDAWFAGVSPALDVPWPMIIFTTEALASRIVQARWGLPSFVRVRETRELEAFPFRNELLALRMRELAASETPQDAYARMLADVRSLTREFLLHDTHIWDHFRTPHLLWCDAAFAASWRDPASRFDATCETGTVEVLNGGAPCWFIPESYGVVVPRDAVMFGGTVPALRHLNASYYQVLWRELQAPDTRGCDARLGAILDALRAMCRVLSLPAGEGLV